MESKLKQPGKYNVRYNCPNNGKKEFVVIAHDNALKLLDIHKYVKCNVQITTPLGEIIVLGDRKVAN
jgi:hypothetical protein